MKQRTVLWLVMGTAMLVAGCSLKVGPRAEPSGIQWEGLGTAYVAVPGFRPYDGTIMALDLLGGAREGEIISLEVWPLARVGIGLIGAQAQVLPLEAAAGVLFYHPRPTQYAPKEKETPSGETGTDSPPGKDTVSPPET